MEPAKDHPAERFTGLATTYAAHRPDYPAGAIDWILLRGGWNEATTVADVGCGTGICSRQLARRGIPVIGIEPNAEMRREAEAEPVAGVIYRAGTGEETGLDDESVAGVVCAQAFHWFDSSRALSEFWRILQPAGLVALVWNERNEEDAATAAYGAIVRGSDGARAVEAQRVRSGHALLECPLFELREKVEFEHSQILDEEGLIGRALSISYAPKEPEARATFIDRLRAVFRDYGRDGTIVLRYITTVYAGQRADRLLA